MQTNLSFLELIKEGNTQEVDLELRNDPRLYINATNVRFSSHY